MTIRRLSEGTVNRIAAGEVVERPASVVKELVDNAIDAGADRIEIVTSCGGRELVRVTDDGSGMSADDLLLAIERHATSKLPDDDLMDIHTLGFRGEALPSIGSVARLTLTSRLAGSDNAHEIRVEAGRHEAVRPAALAGGTRVEVHDLFYVTPARLKFLKSERAESAAIVDVVRRIAMANPAIAFTLATGQGRGLDLGVRGTGQAAWLQRIADIMGREFADNALILDTERDNIGLKGFAGLPTLNRANAQMQYLFVNGRPVRDKLLLGAVRGAYADFMARNRHPSVALFIEVEPRHVDVNVHPAKAEVRFRDAGLVRGLIVGSLKRALFDAGHRASTTVASETIDAFVPGGSPGHAGAAYEPGNQQNGQGERRASFQGDYSYRPSGGAYSGGMREEGSAYHAPLPGLDGLSADARPTVDVPDPDLLDQPLGAARAQLHENYIVAQTADGMVIVDQHAAHERLVYERMKAQLDTSGVARQVLLIPEVVELDEAEAARLVERAGELEAFGLVVDAFGTGAVVVRETPALLGDGDIQGLIRDLVDDLAEFEEAMALKERVEHVCATMACYGSVRSGRRLRADEMNALLREMETTPHAGQCNHGRPTYVELKLSDIERLFGRR